MLTSAAGKLGTWISTHTFVKIHYSISFSSFPSFPFFPFLFVFPFLSRELDLGHSASHTSMFTYATLSFAPQHCQTASGWSMFKCLSCLLSNTSQYQSLEVEIFFFYKETRCNEKKKWIWRMLETTCFTIFLHQFDIILISHRVLSCCLPQCLNTSHKTNKQKSTATGKFTDFLTFSPSLRT